MKNKINVRKHRKQKMEEKNAGLMIKRQSRRPTVMLCDSIGKKGQNKVDKYFGKKCSTFSIKV